MCFERDAAGCHRSLVTAALGGIAPLSVENLVV